ncbi:MAG: hypothetical protein ABI629_05800 [bacterium]
MRSSLIRSAQALFGTLTAQVVAAAVGGLALVGVYGAVSAAALAYGLVVLVVARCARLMRAEGRPTRRAEDWQRMHNGLVIAYGRLRAADLAREAVDLGLPVDATPVGLADATVSAAQQSSAPARSRRELACEAVGLLAFCLLIPADIALYSQDFVSWRQSVEWVGVGVVALCVGLYAWPLRWSLSPRASRRRMAWWGLPFVPALGLLVVGIRVYHPYLDPLREDRPRLAAERVLELPNNLVAAANSASVFDYARLLDQRGDSAQAIAFYRDGLQLDPRHDDVRARLAALQAPMNDAPGGPAMAGTAALPTDPQRSLWESDDVAVGIGRCAVDASLGQIDRAVVVLVPIGGVPEWLAGTVGAIVERELGVPACIAAPLTLPPHTRTHAVVFGRQWNLRSLLHAFQRQRKSLPVSPAKYVLLTPVDLHAADTNFRFANSYRWGALVSFARLGVMDGDRLSLARRTAKATLGALVRSFAVPMSADPHCVTSYSPSLPEFDAKGNRPNAETLALFRRAVRARDQRWAARSHAPGAQVQALGG